MAEIDKAIDAEEQIDLQVRNRDKSMDIEVDVTEEDPELDSFEELEDGTIAFGSMPAPILDTDFSANLADLMDDSELNVLKNDLMDNVESDKDSRSEWEQTYRDGLEFLGMKSEERTQPFEGASGVMHPLLAESVTQF